jgi:hypothetical protein
MEKLRNLRTRMRDWGWRRASYWELMHVLSKLGLHLHYINVGADMREIVGEEEPIVAAEYHTRVVRLEDLLPHLASVPHLSRDFLETVFSRGDVCVANFCRSQLVGYSFSTYVRARVNDQLDVLVPEGFRYGYKAWTHPDHRRQNLSRMRGFVRRRCVPTDHTVRSISYVETHNYASLLHSYRFPSLRAIRMGFCGWITIFGRKVPFNSRHARWVGFEFVRKQDSGRRQYVW